MIFDYAKFYKNQDERKQFLDDAHANRKEMIHDCFATYDLSDLQNPIKLTDTDGSSGTLFFSSPVVRDQTKFKRLKVLRKKLKDDTINFDELKELLRN